MLPNVWSVKEFQRHSNKVFSARSAKLQAIDQALQAAHNFPPHSDQGTKALLALLEAIAQWRASKALLGKKSGRARAVDTLQGQLKEAAEMIYKRRVGEQNRVDASMAAARSAVEKDMKNLGMMKGPVKPPLPPGFLKPMAPAPAPVQPGIPVRTAEQDRLFDFLAQAMINQRGRAMGYDDEDLFDDLDVTQQGRLAARWMLCVPREVTDVTAARSEALRVMGAMLGSDSDVIRNLLSTNLEVVVIPRDKGMTVLDQFESLRGQITHDGRGWEPVRGVGNVQHRSVPLWNQDFYDLVEKGKSGKGPAAVVAIDAARGKVYTAVTEENLLGGLTTAPGGACYATGYSTTTHEFAHSIHKYGLTDADRQTIDKCYKIRLAQAETEEWVDGPRKVGAQTCYAAQTIYEYFAQCSNAWLGANIGNDPYTGKPRHNGKQWVIDHEPKMFTDILERVYGNTAIKGLNPAVIIKS